MGECGSGVRGDCGSGVRGEGGRNVVRSEFSDNICVMMGHIMAGLPLLIT